MGNRPGKGVLRSFLEKFVRTNFFDGYPKVDIFCQVRVQGRGGANATSGFLNGKYSKMKTDDSLRRPHFPF